MTGRTRLTTTAPRHAAGRRPARRRWLRWIVVAVAVTIAARRDGTTLRVAGSIPVAFSAWGIKAPASFGLLGSLADHGIAEFLLTLRQP